MAKIEPIVVPVIAQCETCASLARRVKVLEVAVARFARALLERGDITVNDARAAMGLKPFRFAEAQDGSDGDEGPG